MLHYYFAIRRCNLRINALFRIQMPIANHAEETQKLVHRKSPVSQLRIESSVPVIAMLKPRCLFRFQIARLCNHCAREEPLSWTSYRRILTYCMNFFFQRVSRMVERADGSVPAAVPTLCYAIPPSHVAIHAIVSCLDTSISPRKMFMMTIKRICTHGVAWSIADWILLVISSCFAFFSIYFCFYFHANLVVVCCCCAHGVPVTTPVAFVSTTASFCDMKVHLLWFFFSYSSMYTQHPVFAAPVNPDIPVEQGPPAAAEQAAENRPEVNPPVRYFIDLVLSKPFSSWLTRVLNCMTPQIEPGI